MNHGYVKVAAAIPGVKVAHCVSNADEILKLVHQADSQGVELVAFPELALTACSCGDLFAQQLLIDGALDALTHIMERTAALDIVIVVGMPLSVDNMLINAAVVLHSGKPMGIVPKTYLPNHKESCEKRWFVSSRDVKPSTVRLCGHTVPIGAGLLFATRSATFGVEIGEDLWAPIPPSSMLALHGADVIVNLSAVSEAAGKHAYLCQLIGQQSARCQVGYLCASSGFGESTTDVVFAGNGLIYENGNQLARSDRFCRCAQLVAADVDVEYLRSERRTNTLFTDSRQLFPDTSVTMVRIDNSPSEASLTRTYPPLPFVPQGAAVDERCREIFAIQVEGLAQRLAHTRAKTSVVGISGGLDSTLALLVCAHTYDKLGWSREQIVGVTMPGFGTTGRTYRNAINLMRSLGVTMKEISIKEACLQHFRDLQHDEANHNVVYENAQARERTQLLMDIANQLNGLVVGTGDLSELALGWATYNGDHMSMYGVNAGIPKTLVRHLVKWVAMNHVDEASRDTLLDVVDTPISPELIPADEQGNIKQITEDLVGPYELHDFFLYHFVRHGFRPAKIYMLALRSFSGVHDAATVKKWLSVFYRRFFSQQFKRSCLPDGPKVGSVGLSPRGDWRMPSDAQAALWLEEVERL